MTLDPRKSPAVFSALTAWCAAGTLRRRRVGDGGARRQRAPSTLWGTLGRLVLDLGHAEWTPALLPAALRLYGPAVGLAGIVFVSGGALGRAYYWWRCERHAEPGE